MKNESGNKSVNRKVSEEREKEREKLFKTHYSKKIYLLGTRWSEIKINQLHTGTHLFDLNEKGDEN